MRDLFLKKAEGLVKSYLIETVNEIKKITERGYGKRIIGKVRGKPEDAEILIDQVGERILEKLLEKYEFPARVFSEHKIFGIKKPKIYGALDPFDGSKLFKKGLEHMWYTVLSFYDFKGVPLCSGVADILNEKLYFTENNKNYLISLRNGKKTKLSPSPRKSINGHLTLASYLMSSQYSPRFLEIFGDLVKEMKPKALLYPNGGSFIYSYLAAGLVDAYIMFDEPRLEIDPGYPIAKIAGCEVVQVHSDGSFEPYQFVPGKSHQKVDLLIGACTPELRDELIKYYQNKIKLI